MVVGLAGFELLLSLVLDVALVRLTCTSFALELACLAMLCSVVCVWSMLLSLRCDWFASASGQYPCTGKFHSPLSALYECMLGLFSAGPPFFLFSLAGLACVPNVFRACRFVSQIFRSVLHLVGWFCFFSSVPLPQPFECNPGPVVTTSAGLGTRCLELGVLLQSLSDCSLGCPCCFFGEGVSSVFYAKVCNGEGHQLLSGGSRG